MAGDCAVKCDYEVIEVIWQDHCVQDGWFYVDDIDTDPKEIYSVGILAYENNNIIILVNGVSGDGRVSDPMTILKVNIVERKIRKRYLCKKL